MAQNLDPSEHRAEVKKGDKVPFDGVLLTKEALAYLLSQTQQIYNQGKLAFEACKRECNTKLVSISERCEIRLNSAEVVNKACETARAQDKTIYESALKRSEDTPWWKSPVISAVLGAAAAGTVCGIAR